MILSFFICCETDFLKCRHYDDPSPLILSVCEEQEISIKDVVILIAKEFDFPLNRIKVIYNF